MSCFSNQVARALGISSCIQQAIGDLSSQARPAASPEIVDALRGSITGQILIFHAGDDSVEVAGNPGSRVRSETHVKTPAGRSN